MAHNKQRRRSPALTLRPAAPFHLILLLFSIIFTQLLRNPASAVFFWFLLLMPIISFVFMLIGRAAVQVFVMSDLNRCEKMTPVEYEIRIINTSPIPYPFVEAVIDMPREDGVRCLHQKLILALIPFGGLSIKNTVQFRYRGLYEIGVREIYIYDILRLFRLRIDVHNYSNVTVLPRRLEPDGTLKTAVSDIPSAFTQVKNSQERSEQSNIRQWRQGDTMKSVHWKLSSKAQELQVRDYNTNDDQHVYLFVDFAAPTPVPELEKAKKQKQVKQLMLRRNREKKLSPAAIRRIAGKAENLDDSIGQRIQDVKNNLKLRKQEKKRQRRIAAGNSAASVRSIDEIDALIQATSRKAPRLREAEKSKKMGERTAQREEAILLLQQQKAEEDAIIEKLMEEINGDLREADDAELLQAQKAWGGAPLQEREDEMPELCADGVAEIAVSAMTGELRAGHRCTVAWFDSREDGGLCIKNLNGLAGFEEVYNRFAASPVVPCEQRITQLTRIIGEAANVTVRIITANLDPASLNEYSNIPALFGGAGTGCMAEVLLYNPKENYVSSKDRQEYVMACAARLRQSGVALKEMQIIPGVGGTSVLHANEF